MVKLDKFVGCTVDLIYIDRLERITQRRVIVRQLRDNKLEVYCLQRQQPRRFNVERILSVRRVSGTRIG